MDDWTLDTVANRLTRASRTAQRLPPARVQSYFNLWPVIVRSEFERLAAEDSGVYRSPPSPADIDDLLEVTRWLTWLSVDERLLLWMRADRHPWSDIAKRFGYSRSTVCRQWKATVQKLVLILNASRVLRARPECGNWRVLT